MANVNRYIPPNLREPLRQGGGVFMSLLDNVIGLNNDYDSAGERFGRQVRQDPVGTAKAVGGNLLDSFTGFVQDPVGTVKEGAQEFGQSYNRAAQGAVAYLPEGVELRSATPAQINAANEAFLADMATLSAVVPAGRVGKSLAGAAADVDYGARTADAIGIGRSIAQGDLSLLGEVVQRGGTPKAVGADIKRVPVRGYDPERISRLEANIGLRDEKGRAIPEALEALASQFDASGNRINNIQPDKKTGLTHMHPASNVRMNTPIEEQVVDKVSRGEANPRRDTELKVGDALVAAFGDRVVADTDILGYSGKTLTNPQRMLGGSGYIRDGVNDRIWASDIDVTRPLLASLERAAMDGKNPRKIYVSMGAQSSDFATDELIRDYIRQVDVDPKLRELLAERLVKSKDFTDSNFPMEDLISGGGSRRNMVGLLDGVEAAIDQMNGSNRRAIWQALDNAKFRDAGIPVGEMRLAQTDPDLLFANPFDTGLNLGRPLLGSEVTDQSNHGIYPTAILGQYDGSLPVQVPAAITFREFMNMRRGRIDGIKPSPVASDQRSFLMSHKNIISDVDNQMVDEMGQFTDYWRAFNR